MIVRLASWRPRARPEDALRAWERHAEIVERLPGLRRYVQNHAIAAPDGDQPLYTGIGEAWFDDIAAARTTLARPEWTAVIEDADTFMDPASVVVVWAEPRLVRDF